MPTPSTHHVPAAARYRVGDLEVDVARVRVLRGGEPVPLPKLSFDLLVALIEAAPAVATHDLLLDRVWPGLVVNPETVSQRVKLLRAALGDDPRQPKYINVVRGRGYGLVPEVVRLPDDEVTATVATAPFVAPDITTDTVPPARESRHWLVGGVVVAAVVIGGLVWESTRESTTSAPAATSAGVPAADQRSVAVLPFEALGSSEADRVLAFGFAEAILHQLAGLRDVSVIARTSSFSESAAGLDARAAGARLGARYLLEGSVQREGTQLRVTAQLIDASDGTHVWSVQFDRTTGDIFAVQDEIAMRVAQGLELSLDASEADRLAGQGTRNFDAYLSYLEARSLIAGGRVADLDAARAALQRATELDPRYATALVELAGAELKAAEYVMSGDRRARFEAAVVRARELTDRALALDPENGRAWLQRAYVRAFSDLTGAESDYRRGLSLAPSDAAGHEGLAAVLYQQPRRHAEALAELERAERLDPLEPRYAVTRAVFLLYGRDDVEAAEDLLRQVVQRHPRYAPAQMRLGELLWCCRQTPAEAVRVLESSFAIDPSSEWTRRILVAAYIDLGDLAAAAEVAGRDEPQSAVRRIPLMLMDSAWREAGEAAYDAIENDTLLSIDENVVAMALRRHARVTGEIGRAATALEAISGITWDERGEPRLPERYDLMAAAVGLADMLALEGDAAGASSLRERIRSVIEHQTVDLKRGTRWTAPAATTLRALDGEAEGTVSRLLAAERSGRLPQKFWLLWHAEPAFDSVRSSAEFQQLMAGVASRVAAERRKLDAMRDSGVVPRRPAAR